MGEIMKIEAKLVVFILALFFTMLGIFDYLIFEEPYYPLWIASFIALLATVGIGIINNALDNVIDEELLKDLGDLEEALKPKVD